jgi:hypothetical protein
MKQWQLAFTHSLSSERECCMNIFGLEIRKSAKNILRAHAIRNHPDDGCHGDA